MIYFILSKQNSHTINRYLSQRGASLQHEIGVILYEDLLPLKELDCCVLIFTDLDIIEDHQLNTACKIYDEIRKQNPELTIFNNPHHVKLRYQLLRSLYNSGINSFNVYRVNDELNDVRFPVFIRKENNHLGALTPLLENRKALNTSLLSLELQGWDRSQLLIVEYENVKTPDGYYIRYAALRIGNELFPYLIDYDQQWVAKYVDSPLKETDDYAKTYLDFSSNFKEKDILMKIFEDASIEYGRIDYCYFNGKLVIWEINLNPDFEHKDDVHKYLAEDVRKIKRQMNTRIVSTFSELNRHNNYHVELNDEFLKKNRALIPKRGFAKQLGIKIINAVPIKKEILSLKRALYLTWAKVLIALKGDD